MIYYYSNSEIFKTNLNLMQFANEIDKNKCNNETINNYVEYWKYCLINSYIEEESTIFNYNGRENYYQSINICNSEIRIHFNVTKAIDLIKNNNNIIEQVPLISFTTNEFHDNTSTIGYISTSTYINYAYEKNNDPVILVYFPIGNLFYIVIDGNHRITYKRKNKLKYVNAVLLTYSETISIIDSKFEQYLYSFYYYSKDYIK
ncbi:hypothetical protein [uncultured Thomasclavelia sp.]|uniref:hypothetical protein n=1 Tax=uncultured Thomasclavelia sp. TaxID=3025759 RepID=UPI00280B77CB|nr:hypothetical protein [uncultured Thomasclavelia sp.]